jgi:hypothetical protein
MGFAGSTILSPVFPHIEHFGVEAYPAQVASQFLGDVGLASSWETHHGNTDEAVCYRWTVRGLVRERGGGTLFHGHHDVLFAGRAVRGPLPACCLGHVQRVQTRGRHGRLHDRPPSRQRSSRVGEARRAWGDGWRMSSCRLSISGTTMCACAESSVAGRLLYLQPNGRVYQQKISTLASICPWIRTKGATPWFLCILPSK